MLSAQVWILPPKAAPARSKEPAGMEHECSWSSGMPSTAGLSHVLMSTLRPHLLLCPPRGRSQSPSPAAVGPSFLRRDGKHQKCWAQSRSMGQRQQRVQHRPCWAVPGRTSHSLPLALPAPHHRRLLLSPSQTWQGWLLRLFHFAGVTTSPLGLLHPSPDPAARAATRSCRQQQARDQLFIPQAKQPRSRHMGWEKSP